MLNDDNIEEEISRYKISGEHAYFKIKNENT